MQKFINMLKKDDNTLSIGRFAAVAAVILWLMISAYLAIRNLTWGCYDSFCMTVVALALVQLGNKPFECRMFKIGKGDS